jgi:hypothetical protein
MKQTAGSALIVLSCTTVLLGLGGCLATKPVVVPPPVGLVEITSRPAERALLTGMTAYENGQYDEAEKQLNQSLTAGLASPKDAAAAHKHLAFIFCTSNRTQECEAALRAARKVDPGFALNRSEQGHPVWGPVYKRVLP